MGGSTLHGDCFAVFQIPKNIIAKGFLCVNNTHRNFYVPFEDTNVANNNKKMLLFQVEKQMRALQRLVFDRRAHVSEKEAVKPVGLLPEPSGL
ncbi:MAG: hypothetical protein PUC47_00600 [Oscillospiraceae bacterium]|nr:hypothetical protein [Oscillospiraceae bacterium]